MASYEEMTNDELNELRYQLGMLADDNQDSILNGDNEEFSIKDLDHWEHDIDQIYNILRQRPIEKPRVEYVYGFAAGEGHWPGKYCHLRIADSACVRVSRRFFNSIAEAQASFREWCSEHGITPEAVPAETVRLS